MRARFLDCEGTVIAENIKRFIYVFGTGFVIGFLGGMIIWL